MQNETSESEDATERRRREQRREKRRERRRRLRLNKQLIRQSIEAMGRSSSNYRMLDPWGRYPADLWGSPPLQTWESPMSQIWPNAPHGSSATVASTSAATNNNAGKASSRNQRAISKKRGVSKNSQRSRYTRDGFLRPESIFDPVTGRHSVIVFKKHLSFTYPNARIMIKGPSLGICNWSLLPSALPPPPPRLCSLPSINMGFQKMQQPEDGWQITGDLGQSWDLEKSFKPVKHIQQLGEIRPPVVLASSLRNVRTFWEFAQNYDYCTDQLKSIRHDLVLQGIRSPLTINVYETHMKLAMYAGDYPQFIVSMRQLIELYKEMPHCTANVNEFTAYRLLFDIFIKNTDDLKAVFARLTENQKRHPYIRYAIEMRAMWASCNYKNMFKLYRESPSYGYCVYIVDWFIDRERKLYFKTLVRRHSTMHILDVMRDLVFRTRKQTKNFLGQFPLFYTDEAKTIIDCKGSTAHLDAIM